jgi:hypothetical protein
MIQEFFIASFKVGFPVALASYGLVWWALRNDRLENTVSLKNIKKDLQRISKEKSKNGGKQKLPAYKAELVHRKWLAFGGGFYGVVGLLTYAMVELGEIRDFVTQFDGLTGLIRQISADLIIRLLFDALKNFIVAIAWPVYWLSEIRSDRIWIWFVVAYGGYWLGARYALGHAQK